ncbi:50S ribosomal protein L10 [Proteiniclasticum ruminis]|uniref:Large ribosomal subunit protein uL10 n=1 Tax=Proteiniclasticum ruminis TaxID=398199 RepID=A0A1I5F0M8_9CLOT|nr:50S ribosomal protein L10 [Proteiniclasticum ruminis]SDJ38664.1 large subunit ribosomal protein L10 [Proteiniclasticum ruminis]SFO16881.1 LSU ribosomal protein L10P [Proteiniclasticum ruminis]
MSNSNILEVKAQKVQEIREKMEKAKSLVLVNYQGINVEQDTELRSTLRKNNVEYKVYKNTMVTRAAQELGIEGLEQYLEGPVSIAFGYDDETTAAKLIADFAKAAKKLEIKGGYVDGKVYDAELMNQLAKIPAKEVLIGKFLGSIKSPLSNLVYMLNAVAESKEA